MANLAQRVALRALRGMTRHMAFLDDAKLVSRVADRHVEAKAGWDDKFVGKDARLQWSRHTWLLEELPQKGKKKLRSATLQNPSEFGYLDWWIPGNILMLAKLSPSDDYDKIKSKIDDAYKAAAEKTEYLSGRAKNHWEESKRWVKELNWYEKNVFYLEVTPEGVETFTAEGKDFTVAVEWGTFKAYSPNSDFQQSDPHYTLLEAKSAGAGRKFYKIMKADPNALKSVSWMDFSGWLSKNGVGYDTHFSQW